MSKMKIVEVIIDDERQDLLAYGNLKKRLKETSVIQPKEQFGKMKKGRGCIMANNKISFQYKNNSP